MAGLAPASPASSPRATCVAAKAWLSGPSTKAAAPPANATATSWAKRRCPNFSLIALVTWTIFTLVPGNLFFQFFHPSFKRLKSQLSGGDAFSGFCQELGMFLLQEL